MSKSFITHLKRGEDILQALICYLRQAAFKGERVCSICNQTMLCLTFQMWEGKNTTTDFLNRKHKQILHNDVASNSVSHLRKTEGLKTLENLCASLLTPNGEGEKSRYSTAAPSCTNNGQEEFVQAIGQPGTF